MSIVIEIVIGAGVAFALLLAYVRAVAWAKEARSTRFVFEDRDTYLFLMLDRWLGSGPPSFVTMRALREALRLKLAGVGYQRVLVEVSALRIANGRALWLLVGALGPALLNENVKLALVCVRRAPAEKRLRESGVLTPLPSVREGERYLRSDEPPRRVPMNAEQLDALLVPGRRRAA
jgi:hypothetical protein